ncbi:MAG: sulfatase [Planctomycetota bacterium]|nr:sulfatase [Planctomycetota bacterium]
MSEETKAVSMPTRTLKGLLVGVFFGIAIGAVEGTILIAFMGIGQNSPLLSLLELQLHYSLSLGLVGAMLSAIAFRRRFEKAASTTLAIGFALVLIMWLREGFLIGPDSSMVVFGIACGITVAVGIFLGKRICQSKFGGRAGVGACLLVGLLSHGVTAAYTGSGKTLDLGISAWSETRPPNFLVVLIDTLRADRLGAYGYERNTSPVMDQLSLEGARFEAAYSHAPWTRPSVASLMTSLYPQSHDIIGNEDSLPSGLPTLAQILKFRGYSTAAFSANPQVMPVYGFGRGFDVFGNSQASMLRRTSIGRVEHLTMYGIKKILLPSLSGKKRDTANEDSDDVHKSLRNSQAGGLNKLAFEWVDSYSGNEPFMLYMQYLDPHSPYSPPVDYLNSDGQEPVVLPLNFIQKNAPPWPFMDSEKATPDVLRGLNRLYDAEIAYVDHELGKLIDRLEAKGMMENTIVVVTSDHGEEFYDHNQWLHGQSLFDELVRVPLIFSGPGIQPGVIKNPVGLVDVLPTLATLAGIDKLNFPIHGQDLSSTLLSGESPKAKIVYSERNGAWSINAIRRGAEKLIRITDPSGKFYWKKYNIEKDPLEKTDLFSAANDAELQTLLIEAVESADDLLQGRAGHVEAEGQSREALEALGYMGEDEEN